ncbi:MarR family winged helix-turn-helix transcriptional regulator [Duganella aceris]|uniref:MarR family transcriptional regulator n=1 Tax=Duganella aceris TaxID=2703883 RepID=A0ABX0FU46_9BURK|nr:MarR family transcriptional regulator [Duganella aceris]NGZ87938.1 MarR family transcriptional regulator [Duganella aceris]
MTRTSEPEPKTAPRLAEFLCFAMYSANLTFGKAYKPMLAQLGVTYTQYIAVVALWERDGQTVSELGETLFLESNTLTPLLKKLQAMGLVRRERDAANERHVRLSLTPEGRLLREQAIALSAPLVDACGLSHDGFNATRLAVVKVRDSLVNAVAA